MEIINYILSSLVVVMTPLLFTKIILKQKMDKDKKKLIITIIICMLLYILTYQYLSNVYKSFATFIISIFSIYKCFNMSVKQSILLSVILIVVLVLSELIAINVLKMSGMPILYIYETFAGSLLSNIIVLLIMLPITIISRDILKKIINTKININNKILIFSVLTLISILVFFYDVIANFRIGAKIIFYVIAIITFITALVIVIYQENKNSKLRIEYNKLLEFMKTYEIELEEQRIIKHEYRNQLITIKSKIIDKDRKNKIIDYIDNLLGDNTKFSLESYTKLQYLPANGIKALFYFKIAEAKNKGIELSVNISQSIKESNLKDLTTREFKDLGILIGVYLDNAIEASIQSEKKLLGIEMYDTEEGVMMIISNTYKGIIDDNKIGTKPFTTKGKGRGYGLMLVKNTLINSRKFENKKEITNNLYIQTTLIKK